MVNIVTYLALVFNLKHTHNYKLTSSKQKPPTEHIEFCQDRFGEGNKTAHNAPRSKEPRCHLAYNACNYYHSRNSTEIHCYYVSKSNRHWKQHLLHNNNTSFDPGYYPQYLLELPNGNVNIVTVSTLSESELSDRRRGPRASNNKTTRTETLFWPQKLKRDKRKIKKEKPAPANYSNTTVNVDRGCLTTRWNIITNNSPDNYYKIQWR